MEYQIRHYKIAPGAMARFKDAWLRGVYRLRKREGFDFVGVWGNDETRDFVWILTYAGAEGLEAADARYYELDDRRRMDPDPAQWIEPGGTRAMLTPVVPRVESDGVAQGALAHLADLHARMRRIVDGLDAAQLETAPREGENTIAALVTHALGAEMAWLHRAADVPWARDRASEFRAPGSASALLGLIAGAEERAPALVRDALDAGSLTTREVPGEAERVTVGYCIAHAVAHAAEHVGQAELTRSIVAGR